MKKQKKPVSVRYNTDEAAKNIFGMLVRDFRHTEGSDFAHKAVSAFAGGIAKFREYSFPEFGVIPISRFKRYYQLANLCKKYRFKDDAYTDDDLSIRTINAYAENQLRICSHRVLRHTSFLVLQEARRIAKRILGRYSPEQTILNARFGKKSSIGCPLSLAYIDHKLTNVEAFTGSKECSKWFLESYLPGDPLLAEIVRPLLKSGQCEFEHESLTLVEVPKSWKINRGITPLTLIALHYSYGVGAQIEERLRDAGLDIRKLQERHRKIIGGFSRRRTSTFHGGSHATIDLHAASDSLTSELLNRVLPREWYNACKRTFSRQLEVDGRMTYTASVLPMGNGLTFPVETLVFYCIIRAIGKLANIHGIYSAYGDDLIYPSSLHKYAPAIFENIGLRINVEKTYVNMPFRESCGSDYYRGADVRPCFLPDAIYSATPARYTAWLYKTYNSLCRRWDPSEIPWTLRFIISELSLVSRGGLLRVPPLFPDTSGIKVADPTTIPHGDAMWEPVNIVFTAGSRWYSFGYLRVTAERRVVTEVRPYFWLSLAGRDDTPVDHRSWWETDFSFYHELPQQDIRWEVVTTRKVTLKDGRTFVKQKKKPHCSSRVNREWYVLGRVGPPDPLGKASTGSVSDWV